MARKPTCRKARRSASRHVGRSVRNTILLIFVSLRYREEILHSLWNIKASFVYLARLLFLWRRDSPSQMQKTDSGAIHALPSVWISCFPSVGHLLYGYFMCADLKDASFFGSILSKYERKIVPKTAWRLNLQISANVRTYLCTHWGMSVWWEYHT